MGRTAAKSCSVRSPSRQFFYFPFVSKHPTLIAKWPKFALSEYAQTCAVPAASGGGSLATLLHSRSAARFCGTETFKILVQQSIAFSYQHDQLPATLLLGCLLTEFPPEFFVLSVQQRTSKPEVACLPVVLILCPLHNCQWPENSFSVRSLSRAGANSSPAASLRPVLRFAGCDSLPLHVGGSIGPATLKRLDVIDHVTRAPACTLACRGTGLLIFESASGTPRALDAAATISHTGCASAAVMRVAVMQIAAPGGDWQRERKHEQQYLNLQNPSPSSPAHAMRRHC